MATLDWHFGQVVCSPACEGETGIGAWQLGQGKRCIIDEYSKNSRLDRAVKVTRIQGEQTAPPA